jgi:hypothetical protein
MPTRTAAKYIGPLLTAVALLLVLSPSAARAQEVAWFRPFGSAFDGGQAVAVDGAGDVYAVGFTDGTLPGQVSSGSRDAFVRKISAGGRTLWTRQFGSDAVDGAFAVAVDPAGNALVAGSAGRALPGQTWQGGGPGDAFVRKYSPNGDESWTRQFGTTDHDAILAVAADQFGNAYVAGLTGGALPGQTWAGEYDAFLRKYDPAGQVLWTRQFGMATGDQSFAVAVDPSGNSYVAGTTEGVFPGQEGQASALLPDAFVRKYDPNGAELWTRQLGTAREDAISGLATDPFGNLYAVGEVNGSLRGERQVGGSDAFVRKFAPDGGVAWTRQFGTSSSDTGRAVTVDAAGSVYVGGMTAGSLPGQTATAPTDAFVRKYDHSGNHVWARQFSMPGCTGESALNGLAVDAARGVYAAMWSGCPLPRGSVAKLLQSRNGAYADDFSRVVVSGWGDDYVLPASTAASDLGVTGSLGTLRVPAAGSAAQRSVHASPQVAPGSFADSDVSLKVKTDRAVAGPDSARAYTYLVARRNVSRGASCEYRGRIGFAGPGGPTGAAVTLAASKLVGTAEAAVGGETTVTGMAHAPETWVRARLQVRGTNPTTLRMKAWADGAVEPSSWGLTVVDAEPCLQTTGGYGLVARLHALVTNGPLVFGYDEYRAVGTLP